uniref:Putative DNA-binding pseudobarrel domain-containing protein n=1 Tax=Helianthus annuus TaxID=4232 RepID=A0A251STC4_HELAN
MDQSNNCPSFLKLIEEDDPLFLSKDNWDKKTEPKGKASVLCDENQSSKSNNCPSFLKLIEEDDPLFLPVVAHIDAVEEPTIDEQQDGRVYKFVRMASKDFRLPDNVSRIAKLDSDLKPMTVRLLHLTEQEEFTNRTRREKRGEGFRYALCKWSRFMKRARINEGDTVHFSFDETHQVLNVELVVPHKRSTD